MVYNTEKMVKALKENRVIDKKNKLVLSISKNADRIGISKTTLSRLELGGYPDLTTFAIICKYLGKTMESFFKSKK